MAWKLELDALIESTMTFAKDVKPEPISDLALVVRAAEQALADKSRPIPRPAAIAPMTRPTSERDEILRHVSNFRAHQEKMTREREGYYLQARAKMLALVDPNLTSLNSRESPAGDVTGEAEFVSNLINPPAPTR
jgi:hypothetical protein